MSKDFANSPAYTGLLLFLALPVDHRDHTKYVHKPRRNTGEAHYDHAPGLHMRPSVVDPDSDACSDHNARRESDADH